MKLSEFELDVMEIVWKHPDICAVDIHKAIRADRDVSYSTVKTIVDRLEQKDALTRSKQEGRTIFYSATVSQQQVAKPMVKGVLKRLFSGKPKQLIAHLIEDEELSADDVAALQAMLDSKKQQGKK